MNGHLATAPVTAVLFCYRQEDVVEAAVRSIFAQTLQPDEIILSDDASPDGSYEILCRLAKDYAGPAKITVRQTEGSSGWFAHINACMALARNEQVIVFAGDDISHSGRIERFASEINKCPEARLIWSLMERMTPDGTATGKTMGVSTYKAGKLRGGVGASQCWHKELFSTFGELPPVQAAEDIILPFRAWLLNGLIHIAEPLVLWRDRDYRQLNREQLDRTYEVRNSQFRINASKVMEADLVKYLEEQPDRADELQSVANRLAREIVSVTAEYDVISANSRISRFIKLVTRFKAIGFKRSRRLWQDQILGLPAYLDSAYPRAICRWLPRLFGAAVGIGFVILVNMNAVPRIAMALILSLIVMEAVRMLLRAVAKTRWKPA